MATPNFNLCDVCGARVPKEDRFFVVTGREFDGVENSDEGKHLDLCSKHLVVAVRHLLKNPKFPQTGFTHCYEAGESLLAALDKLKR